MGFHAISWFWDTVLCVFSGNINEHEIYHAHKWLNANNCWHFNIYQHDRPLRDGKQETTLFLSILVFMSN